jgi:hypothetical protein
MCTQPFSAQEEAGEDLKKLNTPQVFLRIGIPDNKDLETYRFINMWTNILQ